MITEQWTKNKLRQDISAKRKELSTELIDQYSHSIHEKIMSLLPNEPIHIHLFLPMVHRQEVNLMPLLPLLWARRDTIYVPRIRNKNMEHVVFTKETLLEHNNRWKIPEPAKHYSSTIHDELSLISIVLTPLMICDNEGYRVGYGGGYYDQFFKEYSQMLKVGIGFFEPVQKIVDTYEGDIPLDIYITPNTIKHF